MAPKTGYASVRGAASVLGVTDRTFRRCGGSATRRAVWLGPEGQAGGWAVSTAGVAGGGGGDLRGAVPGQLQIGVERASSSTTRSSARRRAGRGYSVVHLGEEPPRPGGHGPGARKGLKEAGCAPISASGSAGSRAASGGSMSQQQGRLDAMNGLRQPVGGTSARRFLSVSMDDATSGVYSGFFASVPGGGDVVEHCGASRRR